MLLQTEDRIYLVLEYCDGGDLAAYIHRLGKVSQSLASHFIRQLGTLPPPSRLFLFIYDPYFL